MNNWTPIEHLLEDALYDRLSPAEKALVDAHLNNHPQLALEFAQMRATLDIMDKRATTAPNEQYFIELTDKVMLRSAAAAANGGRAQILPISLAERARTFFSPSNIAKMTAAAALLLVGFFIGRFSGAADAGDEMAAYSNYGFSLDRHSSPVRSVDADMNLEDRVRSYLERSSFLLMLNGSPQLDHEALVTCGFDLDHQQQISRELLVQTRTLKSELSLTSDPQGQAIGDLVSDIEAYLVSINELNDPGDIHSLRPLHNQMDEIFCQVKCNLDNMRR